jgi:AcrR family transcriptional regulator
MSGSRRPYGGVAETERRSERRERLMQAAIEIYSEHGYRGATVRMICDRAGLTSRYFYESFEGGEQLFAACYVQVVGELFGNLARAAAGGYDPEDHAFLIREYFAELQRAPMLSKVFLLELTGINAELDRLTNDVLHRVVALFARDVAVRQPADEWVEETVRAAWISGVVWIARQWVAQDFVTPFDQVVAAAHRVFPTRPPGTPVPLSGPDRQD